ncbi:MAG: phosphoribosylformylglycinamidine synthase subunit PurL [Bdellovibrionaceae bacterium]|nr:phosphoribosylformylglycinamidine synthase subunit PurL [Pseudobdellovibrionaceae bacterium]
MTATFPNDEIRAKAQHYRLNAAEYELITKLLGHPPQGIEWALFSALWSEHCSYKSSKVHLRKFSYRNASVLESEGENAGVVDLGQGERIAFKMESHNHPSFIEPYQGAATGVGGILRDIFTMGARPIGLADFLCFGSPRADRMKSLVAGVVSGISGYGNCVGVPTVTGQTEFDAGYDQNILVNAMAVGLFREKDPMALSKAKGPGNWVVYVGAKTGKDGVHGASMASESFDESSDAKKPNVQIGDPFYEKLLIEACLEILEKNLVVAMQDMGAAGLTSSSFEMSSKGGVGMRMDLSEVPLRDASLTPEEILLSESQERMLLVCEPARFNEIQAVMSRWGLEAKKIGEIQAERRVTLLWRNEVLCDIDPDLLVENAPKHERPYQPWSSPRRQADPTPAVLKNTPLGVVFQQLVKDHRLGSKEWIYRQYDQRVGLRTARDARQSVAFLRLPDSGRGLAMAVGCRPSLMRMDARIGAFDAVFYPALQMALKGARALAVTDCLNFGNPEKPEIMTEFVTSVEAIAEAARLMDAPVISGNVSFYNETLGRGIPPTPATGLVGLRESVSRIPWDEFTEAGQVVYCLSSPLVRTFHRTAEVLGAEPAFSGDFSAEKAAMFVRSCRELASKDFFAGSKAVGAGGLAFTLARMTEQGHGFEAGEALSAMTTAELLEERLYEALVAVPAEKTADFEKAAGDFSNFLRCVKMGRTGGDKLDFGGGRAFSVKQLHGWREGAWTQAFGEM